MAYDEFLAERITNVLKTKTNNFYSKKMMGGMVFMVDNKMFCGIHIDKKYGDSLLMARVGGEAYEKHINREECLPMDFTGRPMKGYLFITPAGFDFDKDIEYWLDLCLKYNPQIKSKK